jgi:hypothetical protein
MHALEWVAWLLLAVAVVSLKWWMRDNRVGFAAGRALRRRWDARHRSSN